MHVQPPTPALLVADALAWVGADEAERTESVAVETLTAYAHAPDADRAFGDEAGTRCALAVARIHRGLLEGAAEALAPVFELPPAKRIHGVVTSVEQVSHALVDVDGRVATELSEHLRTFVAERLTLPS